MFTFIYEVEEVNMGKTKTKIYGSGVLSFLENSEFVIAMRRGLLLCIPFFIIGSFALC